MANVIERNSKVQKLSECSNDSEDWDDLPEINESPTENTICIFTGKNYPSAQQYFTHLKEKENFNIWEIVLTEFKLDFFGYVKLINYLRRNYAGNTPPSVSELANKKSEWENEEYLKPVLEDDSLLQFMIVDTESDEEEDEYKQTSGNSVTNNHEKNIENDLRIEKLNNARLHENLNRALKQIEDMKKFMHDVILTGNTDILRPVSACRQQLIEINYDEEDFEDSGYYGTYSHHEIHAEMLQDTVRTMSYMNAILKNPEVFNDKIVLDVGCGTGILSMFAAQSGAKHVYAVDMSDMAYQAIDIVRENGFQDKITILKSTIEEAKLPDIKVDIIISEWMGYFLLYEAMFDSVLFARKKWLKEDGIMMPNQCSIHLLGAHDENLYNTRVKFWSNVYGFKMSSLRKQVVSEGYILNANASSVVSEPCEVFILNTETANQNELDFKSDFQIKILKTGFLSSIIGYFDVHFDNKLLSNQVMFSTSPCQLKTHWKQTVFLLNTPLEVNEGDVVSGSIDCHKNPKDPRSLVVKLTVGSQSQTFKIE